MAHQLGAGFVPLRKKGKLPHQTRAVEYALEYGTDAIEMHLDAILEGETVMLVDDLIATGGTALAAVELLTQAKARIIAAAFVVDLPGAGRRGPPAGGGGAGLHPGRVRGALSGRGPPSDRPHPAPHGRHDPQRPLADVQAHAGEPVGRRKPALPGRGDPRLAGASRRGG